MKKLKEVYYQLDDIHELNPGNDSKKDSQIQKMTKQFFAKRRRLPKTHKGKKVSS